MRPVPIVLLALPVLGLVCAGYCQTDGVGKPRGKTATPRTSNSPFTWPSWLPEYPGSSDAQYKTGVVPVPGTDHVPGLYYVVSLKEDDDEGLFTFNAPPIAYTKPITEPPERWNGFWEKVETDSIKAVMAFYQGKCIAMGMTVPRWGLEHPGQPVALEAADTRRYLAIRAVGQVSGGGAVVRMRYAPCAGGVDDDKLSIFPKTNVPNPCVRLGTQKK